MLGIVSHVEADRVWHELEHTPFGYGFIGSLGAPVVFSKRIVVLRELCSVCGELCSVLPSARSADPNTADSSGVGVGCGAMVER